MTFQEEVRTLSDISTDLLLHLEPEPIYVKEYIEKECTKLQEEGWIRKNEDRPWIKTFERKNYTLKISFIHKRKGEQITGADLAFEVKNKKVIFVQSKRVGSGGRINFNRFQLQKLIELEGQICGLIPFYSDVNTYNCAEIMHYFYHRFKNYYRFNYPLFDSVLPFIVPHFYSLRATFYHLIMTNPVQIEERFFHTSEISFTLGSNKSISQKEFLNQGLKSEDFLRMFWECKIGGPDIRKDIKKVVFYNYSLLTNRFIIWLDIEER